jgi:hypothetical protein
MVFTEGLARAAPFQGDLAGLVAPRHSAWAAPQSRFRHSSRGALLTFATLASAKISRISSFFSSGASSANQWIPTWAAPFISGHFGFI